MTIIHSRLCEGKNNRKMGPGVVCESRPTGYTCPQSCPLLTGVRTSSGKLVRCYSDKKCRNRHFPNIMTGLLRRDWERAHNRLEWRARRTRDFRKAKAKGQVLRINVHGDIMAPNKRTIDSAWCLDIAHCVKESGIRAWMYTHAWKDLSPALHATMADSGIVVYASVHNGHDADVARKKGFPIAMMSTVPTDGSDSIPVCFHQTHGVQCGECRRCLTGADVRFLEH
jgi:hypothetical protein